MSKHEKLLKSFDKAFPRAVLDFRPATDSWKYEGVPISVKELVGIVASVLDVGNQAVSNLLINVAFARRKEAAQALVNGVEILERSSPDDSELRRFLKLIEHPGTESLNSEANVVAMKQWIWMVKRHALNREVQWHVAPIFWSTEGGTGKSYNIKRLIAPFDGFTRHITEIADLGERFSGRLFASTLIVFLDEFAGAEKASVAQLKAILTGSPIDKRTMHSESGFFADNRMSCIATSNLRPPHGFVDTTGARRFWSIRCSGQDIKNNAARKAAFDAIDFAKIWCAVSVEAPAPQSDCDKALVDLMEQVRETELRSKSSLESFCLDELEVDPDYRMHFREFRDLYSAYCAHTRQIRFTGPRGELRKALEAIGIKCVKPGGADYVTGLRPKADESEAATSC